MSVTKLTVNVVRSKWQEIEPFISKALEKSKCDDYNIDDVYRYITLNQWCVYVAIKDDVIHGAAVVSMVKYPHDVVAYVCAIGGRMVVDRSVSDEFFKLLKEHGASRVQGAARPSIVRLWRRIGLEEKYAIVEGKL